METVHEYMAGVLAKQDRVYYKNGVRHIVHHVSTRKIRELLRDAAEQQYDGRQAYMKPDGTIDFA